MKRLICTMAVLLALCVPARAQEAIHDGVRSGVTSIGEGAFEYCYCMAEYHMKPSFCMYTCIYIM